MFSFLLLVIQAKPCCLISNLNLLLPEVAKTEFWLLNFVDTDGFIDPLEEKLFYYRQPSFPSVFCKNIAVKKV